MSAAKRRQGLSKRLRFEVFKRDQFTCQYCGAHPPAVVLHIDHIEAVANGGTSDIDNLVTACEACNHGKADIPLSSVPESLASKAARIAEAEEQLAGYNAIMRAKAERLEADTWDVAELLWPGCATHGISRRWLYDIKRFVERLGVSQCQEFAELAASYGYGDRRRFLYFCGCCWRVIKSDDRNGRWQERP